MCLSLGPIIVISALVRISSHIILRSLAITDGGQSNVRREWGIENVDIIQSQKSGTAATEY
jgi:hypothetical protein